MSGRIEIKNRRATTRLKGLPPDVLVADVTSKGPLPWQRFSPFFPHGGIPVPFSPGVTAASVEGVWQGLKVFSGQDVDLEILQRTSMKNLKRTTQRLGSLLGHRRGLAGEQLLDYRTARYEIYLPCYRWVLDHCLRVGNSNGWASAGETG